MKDSHYLIELSHILINTPSHSIGDSRGTKYIMIEANTANEIAEKLMEIAERMNITVQ